jgi:hypothetical protein
MHASFNPLYSCYDTKIDWKRSRHGTCDSTTQIFVKSPEDIVSLVKTTQPDQACYSGRVRLTHTPLLRGIAVSKMHATFLQVAVSLRLRIRVRAVFPLMCWQEGSE